VALPEVRVTTLELFFDLVFVFTLTQLTALLADRLTLEGAFQVVLIFVVLFWMYGGYAHLTNQVPPDRDSRRLLLILGMGAFLLCALAVPLAFDGGGVAFGLAYLGVVVVHIGLYSQVYERRVVLRFAPLNVLAAGVVVLAGLLDTPTAYLLWLVAIAVTFLTPMLAGQVANRFDIRAVHFVERHGLLLIVALGESVVAIGIGIETLALDAGTVAAALVGLGISAALWWAYFVHDAEVAEHVMRNADADRRFRLAINAYFYAFTLMLLGVVAIAAGVKKSIGHVGEQLEPGSAIALAVGIALYLGGGAAFRLLMGLRPVAVRIVAAALGLATVAIGTWVSAGAQLVAISVVLVGMLLVEAMGGSVRGTS
jgi:low temperature requirement protein LtrA